MMTRIFWLTVLLGLVQGVSGCGHQGAACYSDGDCYGTGTCQMGACVTVLDQTVPAGDSTGTPGCGQADCSAKPIALSIGDQNACALFGSGAVKCWGNNQSGQLGDGTETNRSRPVDVVGLAAGVKALSAGGAHTCALLNTGGLQCWGANDKGQLGDGTSDKRLTPVDVARLGSGVKALSAGAAHTCALLASGATNCWGSNSRGQLGNSTGLSSPNPAEVFVGRANVGLSTGGDVSCVQDSKGVVSCWGSNQNELFGNATVADRPSPAPVSGLDPGASSVQVGTSHACALLASGAVRCWGKNSSGELGDGSKFTSSQPVEVSMLLPGTKKLAVGGLHTCALASTGEIQCWGARIPGVATSGSQSGNLIPILVEGLGASIIDLAAGKGSSCALLEEGEIRCWGTNESGQLGDGSLETRYPPATVRF